MSDAVCTHPNAEPVITCLGETVNAICPRCLDELPAKWIDCDHVHTVSLRIFADPGDRRMCRRCGGRWTEEA